MADFATWLSTMAALCGRPMSYWRKWAEMGPSVMQRCPCCGDDLPLAVQGGGMLDDETYRINLAVRLRRIYLTHRCAMSESALLAMTFDELHDEFERVEFEMNRFAERARVIGKILKERA